MPHEQPLRGRRLSRRSQELSRLARVLAPFLVETGPLPTSTAELVAKPLLAPLVELPAGPTVLAPEVKVSEYSKAVQAEIESLEKSVRALEWKQGAELTAAGGALLAGIDHWDASQIDEGLLVKALRERRAKMPAGAETDPGRLRRVATDLRERRLEMEEAAWPEVDEILVEVARSAPKTAIADAEAPRARASRLEEPLDRMRRELERNRNVATWLGAELHRRQESRRWVNFDCVFHAAYLVAFGPAALTVPLDLANGETGLHIAPVATASPTKWFGPPPYTPRRFFLEHTGLPYKLGSLWPARLPRSGLNVEDHGNLILTDRRLAYRGAGLVEFPLESIETLDEYDDALVIGAGGKTHHFLLLSRPTRFTLLINYLAARRDGTIPPPGTTGYDLLGEFLLRTGVIEPPVPLELEEFWAAELLQAVQRIPKTLAREVAGGGLFWAEKALGGLHALVSSRRRRS